MVGALMVRPTAAFETPKIAANIGSNGCVAYRLRNAAIPASVTATTPVRPIGETSVLRTRHYRRGRKPESRTLKIVGPADRIGSVVLSGETIAMRR